MIQIESQQQDTQNVLEQKVNESLEGQQQYTSAQFKTLFFNRIGMKELETVTFDDLPTIMEAFAYACAFENLDMVNRTFKPITRDNNITKILVNGEGGLCYNLNTLFYLFLKETGFDVIHIRATVKDPAYEPSLWASRYGHMITILTHKGQEYITDVGFGLFLALRPIPFTENPQPDQEGVVSRCGAFRFVKKTTDYGTYALELKKKNKETGESYWDTGYAFDKIAVTEKQAQEAQLIILNDKTELFNKHYLATKLQKQGGQATLSGKDKVFILTKENGDKERIENVEQDSELFKSLLVQYMGFKSK